MDHVAPRTQSQTPVRVSWSDHLVWYDQHSVPIDPNDVRATDYALNILMLVSMKHEFRLGSLEVMPESGESKVRIIFPIMNQQRRIVGHEYIHRRKVL